MSDDVVQDAPSPIGSGAGAAGAQGMLIRRTVTIARWREAEATVYPVLMTSPAAYEAALTAIALMGAQVRAVCQVRDDLFRDEIDELMTVFTADEALAAAVAASGMTQRLLFDATLAQTLLALPE